MDAFDLEDAFGAREAHMCSGDLREFIADNHLDLNQGGVFNPRDVFGSHYHRDHIYNTPRAWYMLRCLAPYSRRWDGENAEYTPECDNLPWALVPDRKVTAEEIKAILSSHYQGTPFNPYSSQDSGKRGMYRSIGINRTGVTSICQIRTGVPEAIRGVEWICFGSTTFDAILPVYANVERMPGYLSNVTLDVSTENFYWGSRLIGALADHSYGACIQHIERYQDAVATKGRRLILEYDRRMAESGDFSLAAQANEDLARMAREQTVETLNKVLLASSESMKNGYSRSDN